MCMMNDSSGVNHSINHSIIRSFHLSVVNHNISNRRCIQRNLVIISDHRRQGHFVFDRTLIYTPLHSSATCVQFV